MDDDDDVRTRFFLSRIQEKLDAGLISEEEYTILIKQNALHDALDAESMALQAGGRAGPVDHLAEALRTLAGSILEPGEKVAAHGGAVLLGGVHGATPVRGHVVLTCFRLLFLGRAAADAASPPTAVRLIRSARVLPESASLPLLSVLTAVWTREKGGVVLTASAKCGRTLRLLFAGGDADLIDFLEAHLKAVLRMPAAAALAAARADPEDPEVAAKAAGLPPRAAAVGARQQAAATGLDDAGRVDGGLGEGADGARRQPTARMLAAQEEARWRGVTSVPSPPPSAVHGPSSSLEQTTAPVGGAGLSSADWAEFNAWRVYDPAAELRRIGVADDPASSSSASAWVVCRENEGFGLSESYPALLSVPRNCNDASLLFAAARFRSKGRIPALCWRDAASGATLSRCAQPLSGLNLTSSGRSKCDEALVRGLWNASALPIPHDGCGPHLILDCRPKKNAQANAVAGRGFENMLLYGRRRDKAPVPSQAEQEEAEKGAVDAAKAADSGRESRQAIEYSEVKLKSGKISDEEFAIMTKMQVAFLDSLAAETSGGGVGGLNSGSRGSGGGGSEVGGGTLWDEARRAAQASPLPACELVFADIENIHAQRHAFRDLIAASNAHTSVDASAAGGGGGSRGGPGGGGGGGGGGGVGGGMGSGGGGGDGGGELLGGLGGLGGGDDEALWAAGVAWLRHVSAVLAASRTIARAMSVDRRSVLVHCSDGWDRTAQVREVGERKKVLTKSAPRRKREKYTSYL